MAFTFFFRDMHTLGLVEEHVIPWMKSRRFLDIWDAGCASGPEPYTLAILLRENMGEFQFKNVRIHATDQNGAFGEVIARGEYPEEIVKRIPSELLQKYFTEGESPKHLRLSENLRKCVRFARHDLTSYEPIRHGLGLIVCKNVLLHLRYDQRINVLRMFNESLESGGYLAMEPTQQLPPLAEEWFDPVTATGGLFKKKK